MSIRCNNCFYEYEQDLGICPSCGFEEGDGAKEPYFLLPGMLLKNRYIVGKVLGFGGFGITYKAWDTNLDTVVAIKEYFYTGLVARQPGEMAIQIYAQNRKAEFGHFLERFLEEARHTAKFLTEPNIVDVYNFFAANNTAYMVMEYLDGIALNELLKKERITLDRAITITLDVCKALRAVHKEKILHRDVSPDNIFVCKDGTIKLLDFGAARFDKHEEQEVVRMTMVMKPGFSPPEQYQTISRQGPWTDVYALGATLYYMATGEKPQESTNRKTLDELPDPNTINTDVSENFNNAIMRSMAVETHLRYQTVEEFETALQQPSEKHVLNVREIEVKRKRKRALSLTVAMILLFVLSGVAGFAIFKNYELVRPPKDVTFSVWYIDQGGKKDAMESICEEFKTNYASQNVTIELRGFDPYEYYNALSSAFQENNTPTVFESDNVSEDILENSKDLSRIVSILDVDKNGFPALVKYLFFKNTTDNLENFQFLNQYDETGKKQFPLGYDAPIKWKLNNPPKTNIKEQTLELFIARKIPEYTGLITDYDEIYNQIPGAYTWEKVLPSKDVFCYFAEMFSVSDCDEKQYYAACVFIAGMLTSGAQTSLLDGAIPLNKDEMQATYLSERYPGLFDGFFDNAEEFAIKVK